MKIPPPARGMVPCSETCVHADCVNARNVAATRCVRCQQPIGYDRHYRRLNDGFNLLEHHHCRQDENPAALRSVVADIVDSLDTEIAALTTPHVPGLPDGWGRCEIVADDLRAIRRQLTDALGDQR